MFGMGWQEILLILVVAVLVIGPDQLPQVARTIGKLVAQFRRLSNELRDTVNREFTENEDFKDFREFHQSIDTEFRNISDTAKNYVETEIAKEEDELKKFEDEVREAVKEPGSGSASSEEAGTAEVPETTEASTPAEPTELEETPGRPKDSWTYVPDEVPAADAEPTATGGDEEAEPGKSDSPRKETA